jgi:hypothetical protein
MAMNAEQRAKQLADRDDQDILWLMSTPQGRRIMNRILTVSGFESLCMTGNGYTVFNDGKRAVGQVFYQAMLHLCPEAFIEMLKEAKHEVKETEELIKHDSTS